MDYWDYSNNNNNHATRLPYQSIQPLFGLSQFELIQSLKSDHHKQEYLNIRRQTNIQQYQTHKYIWKLDSISTCISSPDSTHRINTNLQRNVQLYSTHLKSIHPAIPFTYMPPWCKWSCSDFTILFNGFSGPAWWPHGKLLNGDVLLSSHYILVSDSLWFSTRWARQVGKIEQHWFEFAPLITICCVNNIAL